MPTIDFTQLSALPITELAFAEPSVKPTGDDAKDLFNDYLHRANTATNLPDMNDRKPNESKSAPVPSLNTEQRRQSDDHSKVAGSEKTDRDREQANEASSPTTPTYKDHSTSTETSVGAENEKREEPYKLEQAKQEDAKEAEMTLPEKNAVKDKKKAKEEKKESKPINEMPIVVQKDAGNLPAVKELQPTINSAEKTVADEKATVKTEQVRLSTDMNLPLDNSAAQKVKSTNVDVQAVSEKAGDLMQTFPTRLDEVGTQTTVDNPADAIFDTTRKGKVAAKKARELVDGKNTERKQKTAGENHKDITAAADSAYPTATAGNETSDVVHVPSVQPQTPGNIMQAVVEVLKNAERPAVGEDSLSPIGDVRATSSAKQMMEAAAQNNSSASARAGSDNASGVNRAQFVQRVERAFAAMGNRDGNVRLKLSPPELGVLKLEIGVHKGVMKARVEAETPAAKNLLLDNLPELRERLAQQNIHIQQFDVDLMDRSPGGMSQHTFGQGDSHLQQGNHSSPHVKMADNMTVGPTAAASPVQQAGMGASLNVFV